MTGSEVELARFVIAELERDGYECAQEVQTDNGCRADIVATLGQKTVIVETKKSLSLAVIIQAERHYGTAHRIMIATWKPTRPSRALGVLRRLGIGLIEVSAAGAILRRLDARPYAPAVREQIQPSPGSYTDAFGAAGGQDGGWSAFKQTGANLREYVRTNPGAYLATAVEWISHHYAHDDVATRLLPGYIRKGSIKGLRVSGTGRLKRLYLEDDHAD